MTRKQLKTAQNVAAKEQGRATAKAEFAKRSEFVRLQGAFMHRNTGALFAL
jgi:hypothetical protein